MEDRDDAVTSMVYEATARLRDPVYGCVGLIASLQKHVFRLQSELNAALAETMALRTQLSDALTIRLTTSPPPRAFSVGSENNFSGLIDHQLVNEFNNCFTNNPFDAMLEESCQASEIVPEIPF